MNINTGPLTREIYEICVQHERYPASHEQTALCVRLSAFGDKVESLERENILLSAELRDARQIVINLDQEAEMNRSLQSAELIALKAQQPVSGTVREAMNLREDIVVQIRAMMADTGINMSMLARRLNITRQYISRSLHMGAETNFTIETLEQIAELLGCQVKIEISHKPPLGISQPLTPPSAPANAGPTDAEKEGRT